MKKSTEVTTTTEYFQPFSLKPNQIISPKNAFDGILQRQELWNAETNKWCRGLVVAKYQRRERAKCLGVDSTPRWLVVKLLQFHTSYRPAYYGTWKTINSNISPRNPFAQAEALEYEYDSDDDWGEDADILDAESISGSEEDVEEDETDLSEIPDDEQSDSNVSPTTLSILISTLCPSELASP